MRDEIPDISRELELVHLRVSRQASGIPAVVTGELAGQILGGVVLGERAWRCGTGLQVSVGLTPSCA